MLQTQQTLRKKSSYVSKNKLDITFENVSYSVQIPDNETESCNPFCKPKKSKLLLNNLTGIFKGGTMNAIMGASGAGKTTLLNTIACRISMAQKGRLFVNSTPYSYETFGDFANYVMQSDVLMQTLTVRETLQFAADLKLNISEEEKNQKFNYLVRKLKLDNCLDTIVGGNLIKGISGGQKKRTSIGFELISDPQVIMLDEPTSGLDSMTSFIIIKHLSKLCHKYGKTVIMTIHQPGPQIFKQFDNLLLMIEGKIIYQGGASEASDYFQRQFNLSHGEFSNPGDFFMSVMHHQDAKNRTRYPLYFQKYDQIIAPKIVQQIKNKSSEQVEKRASQITMSSTLKTLIKRDFLNVVRNPLLIKSRLMQTIVLGIYIGGLYAQFTGQYTSQQNWRALTGFMFFICINNLMMGLAPVSLIFPTQRQVFLKQESSRLYTTLPYFLSRNIIEIPYSIIFPLLMSLILYWFVGLANTAGQFFTFYLTILLINFSGTSLGFFIGSVVQDDKSVSTITPIILLPFILISGFFKNRNNLPSWIGWLEYISPMKYAFIALTQNEVINAEDSNISRLNFDVSLWASIGILAAIAIALRLFSLFFLHRLRNRPQ